MLRLHGAELLEPVSQWELTSCRSYVEPGFRAGKVGTRFGAVAVAGRKSERRTEGIGDRGEESRGGGFRLCLLGLGLGLGLGLDWPARDEGRGHRGMGAGRGKDGRGRKRPLNAWGRLGRFRHRFRTAAHRSATRGRDDFE